ncbi:MAG: hypothetical protein GXP35_01875 [Actinobacteria bacterium]|nr:hypothetical protein [Actinomycetota bacterium]
MNWILLLGTLAVFLVAFSSWRYFVRPTTDRPESADAIVLFAGGRGERLETAIDLLEDGVASHLVLPNGNLPQWAAANRLCDGEWDFEVHCFAPDPDNTWGEATGAGKLAAENGWDRLVWGHVDLSRAPGEAATRPMFRRLDRHGGRVTGSNCVRMVHPRVS